jgi:hypothetical protein
VLPGYQPQARQLLRAITNNALRLRFDTVLERRK